MIAPRRGRPGLELMQLRKPKRSACSITMMVAFGTSTPTSITVVDTRMESSPAANAAMTRSFSLPCEAAMHKADPVAEAVLQRGVTLLCRGHIQHLGFGNQRTDPIDLRALGDGAFDLVHQFL